MENKFIYPKGCGTNQSKKNSQIGMIIITALSKPEQVFAWVPTEMAILPNGMYNNTSNKHWEESNPFQNNTDNEQCSSELREKVCFHG